MMGYGVYVQHVDRPRELRDDHLAEGDAIELAVLLARQARVSEWNAVWVEDPNGARVWDAEGTGLMAPSGPRLGDPRDAAPGQNQEADGAR